jgi:hypothetical protein
MVDFVYFATILKLMTHKFFSFYTTLFGVAQTVKVDQNIFMDALQSIAGEKWSLHSEIGFYKTHSAKCLCVARARTLQTAI